MRRVRHESHGGGDAGIAAGAEATSLYGGGAVAEEAERVSSNTSSIAAEAARPPAFLDIVVVGFLLVLCTLGAWLAWRIGTCCHLDASASWARRERGCEHAATRGGVGVRLARPWELRADPCQPWWGPHRSRPPLTPPAHPTRTAHSAETKAYTIQFDALVRSLQSDARRQVDARLVAAQTGAMMLSLFPSLAGGVGANVPYFMAAGTQLRHLTNSSFAQWLFVVDQADRSQFESNARAAAVILNYTQRPIGNLTGYHNSSYPPPVMGIQPRYVPMWASSPRTPETDARVLGDYVTLPVGPTIQRCISEGRVVMTRYCVTPTFKWTPGVQLTSPAVVVLAPSWAFVDGHLREDPIGGTIDPLNVTAPLPPSPANGDSIFLLSFQWENLIAETLPSRPVDGLQVVLQPPEGPAVTFAIEKGNRVVFVGSGDLHDRRQKPKHRAFQLLSGQDVWLVHVYGTAALRKKFITEGARSISFLVAFLALACIIVRVVYDFIVRRRMRRLLSIAHKNQERFFEAQAQLLASRQSDKAKDQFVSMVSHEIRTPLNATAGAIALLRESGTTPEQDELLDIATAGSAQVVLVITDILSQAALQSGTFTICDAPMRLRKDVVDPTWRMIQMGIQKKLSFILEVDNDVPEWVMGDAARCSQILANLLHNATKFTPSGGIRLSVSTAPQPPRSSEDDAQPEENTGAQLLVFAVQDTGIGLQSKDLDRIFAPFVQAESRFTTRTHGGTGLGLTICLRLARAMGGDIKAFSLGPGQGATFTFTVPLRLPTERRASGELSGEDDDLASQKFGLPPAPSTLCLLGKEVAPQSFGEPAPHILLVDDDRLSITVMRKILVSRGAVVTIASDGAEAVEAFRADGAGLDLILMDVRMPKMDGRTAARKILQMQDERKLLVPIIGLTACAASDDIRQCLDAGMCAHITKPINATDLVQIKRVIASCRRKRERARQETVEEKSSPSSSSSFEVTPRNSFDDEVAAPPADQLLPAPAAPQAAPEPEAMSHPPSLVSLRSTSSTSSGQGAPLSPVTPRQAGQAVRRFLDSSISPPSGGPLAKRFTGPPPCILVVEDDAMSQLVMRRLLSTMGAGEVVVVDNGVKAVEAFETGGTFDLVLMDLHMPVMDGLTATKLILEGQQTRGWPRTPILALTASVSDLEKSRCEASGMAGHIGKPFQLGHIGLLQLAIDESRRRQAQKEQ